MRARAVEGLEHTAVGEPEAAECAEHYGNEGIAEDPLCSFQPRRVMVGQVVLPPERQQHS